MFTGRSNFNTSPTNVAESPSANAYSCYNAGQILSVLDLAMQATRELPLTAGCHPSRDKVLDGIVTLTLGIRAAQQSGFDFLARRFFEVAKSLRTKRSGENRNTFLEIQRAIGLIEFGEFGPATTVLSNAILTEEKLSNHTPAGIFKLRPIDTYDHRTVLLAEILRGYCDICNDQLARGVVALEKAVNKSQPQDYSHPHALEYLLKAANALAAIGSVTVAQKLYQAVQRIAKKLWKIDNSDELAIRTFARARAAYAYTLCKMERTGSDEPIASARGILGSQRRDSFAALCLDMCNTSPRPNLQDLLQAFDHARFAYLTIDDGLQLPLAWEISVRCTYAQRLLDVSRVIIDYMVVFKDISIERSRSFTDKVFSTLRSSTAMDLALRVVCPEVKESVPSYLLRCVSTFIAQCDEHFYTALEITKSKKGITPFERGLLIQKIEVARAFLRHTLIGESDLLKRHSQDSSFFNFNFGEPIQADHVTSSLESPTSIPAGRRTLLLTRIRDLIRTGAYADANTLLQEVSQYEFTLHEYIELEIERAFATTSGEPPAHIVARFQELFEMVNDAPDHDYRMRIRAYEHIFAASVQISESKDDALPLKVLNALGSLCIRHKLPNPAPALATIYGWTDLPALTDALHCLPRNFTIPESLWIALIDRVQTHSRRDASEKNAAASIHATLEAMAEYCRTCEKGDEKRIAEVTALRGNCFLPSSPYFPSLSALTDATDAAWRERKPDLQMNIHRLIADAANRDNNSMLLLRSCTTVFAIAEAFTLNNAEDKRHCSRLLGNRLFKIARSLVDNNARPRVAQVLKRLTILQNNYEFLRCFFLKTSMRLPEIEASALPRSSLLAFHPGLNTLARNLLVGPVAALLEDGATRNGVLDASETTLQRCLRLYK